MKNLAIEELTVNRVNPDSLNFSTCLCLAKIDLTITIREVTPEKQAEGTRTLSKNKHKVTIQPKKDYRPFMDNLSHADLSPLLPFWQEVDFVLLLRFLDKQFDHQIGEEWIQEKLSGKII